MIESENDYKAPLSQRRFSEVQQTQTEVTSRICKGAIASYLKRCSDGGKWLTAGYQIYETSNSDRVPSVGFNPPDQDHFDLLNQNR